MQWRPVRLRSSTDTGGYGFIETEDSDEDVFFHMENVGAPDLEEGQEVEFEIEQADKGPRATNLTRVEQLPRRATPSRAASYSSPLAASRLTSAARSRISLHSSSLLSSTWLYINPIRPVPRSTSSFSFRNAQ